MPYLTGCTRRHAKHVQEPWVTTHPCLLANRMLAKVLEGFRELNSQTRGTCKGRKTSSLESTLSHAPIHSLDDASIAMTCSAAIHCCGYDLSSDIYSRQRKVVCAHCTLFIHKAQTATLLHRTLRTPSGFICSA